MLTSSKRKKKLNADVENLLREVVRSQRSAERRRDSRIDISIVVAVVPYNDGQPDPSAGFVTVTKNISGTGIMLIVNKNLADDKVLVGFPGQNTISFVTARILYRETMPLGCYKLGLSMGQLVKPDRYPDLQKIGRL